MTAPPPSESSLRRRSRHSHLRRSDRTTAVAVGALAASVLALVLYPLAVMLRRAFIGEGASWGDLVSASWFPSMISDTLIVVVSSSVIACLLAAALAWINERTDAGIGPLGDALPLVPLFLPSVAMAIGWVLLLNPTVGFINGLFRVILDPLGISFELNIYSYYGMIFVYVLNLLPYAYLPIVAGFRTLDPSLEEAARVSGASPWHVFRTVSLPAIAPSILSGFVLVTVVSFALFSVPVIIGTRPNIEVLAVRIIRAIRNNYPPAFDEAVMLSTILFGLLAALWWVQRRLIGSGNFAKVGGRSTGGSRTRLGAWRYVARGFLLLYLLFAAVLPVVALGIVSVQSYWQPNLLKSTWTLDHYDRILFSYPLGLASVRNSLFLGLVGGAITVLVAGVLIVYAQRHRNRLSKWADSVAKLPAAVPNTVLAVAFIFAFAGPPFSLGGTLKILFLAYFVVYVPYASIASEASAAQIDKSLEEASSLSGASQRRTFRTIVLPLMAPGLLADWALVFVRVLGDLSVAVLLGTGRTPVIGFVLLDVWDQGIFNRVAVLALVMTLITMPIVVGMMWLGRPRWRRVGRG